MSSVETAPQRGEAAADSPTRTRAAMVWDAPVRVIHWSFVPLIAFSWWTGENGHMEWHRYSGLTLLAFLIFRVYWGFAGSSTARFAQFVRGPRTILQYLRDRSAPPSPGHNPLGALSVIALLTLMLLQVVLGLFAVDVDGIESGPLSHLVSFDAGRWCAETHEVTFEVLWILILLHVAAVLFYWFVKRTNLIGAMVHGRTRMTDVSAMQRVPAYRVIVGIIISVAVVWAVGAGLWT